MSGVVELSVLATEYVKFPVRLEQEDLVADPTAATVEAAYTALGVNPVSGDWVTGSWDTGQGRYFARVLTGPSGDVAPAVGVWSLWYRITLSPEIVVVNAGELVVT